MEVTALPTGASVDNIFYFNGSGGAYLKRVIDGPIRASQCGIFGNGSDMSSFLHAAANHADIKEIIFDYPGGASINIGNAQAVSIPTGKVLRFEAGNMLTGTGTVSGGIIDASYDQQIFSTTFAISPEGVVGEVFSAKWFGAVGDGSNPDHDALQAAIDCVINNFGTGAHLFLPAGNYSVNKGLLVFFGTAGSQPTFTNIKISGSIGALSGVRKPETIITCTHNDNFALAIQLGNF